MANESDLIRREDAIAACNANPKFVSEVQRAIAALPAAPKAGVNKFAVLAIIDAYKDGWAENPETQMRGHIAALNDLRAAVTGLPDEAPMGVKVKPLEWEPIKDAPRDGSWFFARTAKGRIRLVQFADKYDRYPISRTNEMWETAPVEWVDTAAFLAALEPPTPMLGDALELLAVATQSIGNARYKLDTGFSESAEDMVYEHGVISDILGDLESGLSDLRAVLVASKGGDA